jgi:O-acetyl-ADP-ribose deacetylase
MSADGSLVAPGYHAPATEWTWRREMQRTIADVLIECVQGDIAAQDDLTAVVNAANAELLPGGGVAGAIHSAAGPKLAEECRKLAPITPGDAVLTGAYDLPNRYVIHCLGPVYGADEPADRYLAACYRNALTIAEKAGIDSIGFPSISTGVFGYPMQEAAEVAFNTIHSMLKKLRSVRHIRFVLFDEEATEIHRKAMEREFLSTAG